jgi:hypothetical protein
MLSRCSSLVLEYDDNNVNIVISSSMIGELRQAWEHTLIECWETTHLFILSKERGNVIPLLIEAAKLAPSAEHSFSRAPARSSVCDHNFTAFCSHTSVCEVASLSLQPILALMYQVMSSPTFQHLYSVDWL